MQTSALGSAQLCIFHLHKTYVNNGGLGIYIDHSNGVVSRYIHLDKIEVTPGTTVKKGQRIGTMGGSNYVNGKLIRFGYAVHLDFQIRVNDVPVDPLKYYNIK